MALLEYLHATVPDVVKKSVESFYAQDPLLDALKKRGMVKRTGGTNVRLKRIKSDHSDVTQINGSNISIPLQKRETFDSMTGDWGRLIKPMIIPHVETNRMQSPAEKKMHVDDVVKAAMTSLRNDVSRRIYVGDTDTVFLSDIATLNGGRSATPNTNGTSNGLINGAMEFDTPTAQAAAGNSYLNLSRREDTVRDLDNYYNQFEAHSGIGTNFLSTVERIKARADTYASEGGIDTALLSITDHAAVGDEIRATSGGNNSPLVYTMADYRKGDVHKPIVAAGGVMYNSNRWMTAARLGNYSGSAGNINEACYLLNPNYIEYWVNAGHDFEVRPFFDGLQHGNQDADIGYIILEIQVAISLLIAQGCTRS